jgi:acetyltransferase-like isoleucine patch superfamily enzyme
MPLMNSFKNIYFECRKIRATFSFVMLRTLYYRLNGKRIISSNRVSIYGLKNIQTKGLLKIGIDYVGFMDRYDRTLIRNTGSMHIIGNVSIGKGCRLDIGENAILRIHSAYINANSTLVIMHGLTIGAGSVISWGCQFLDEDFHSISYAGKFLKSRNEISVGNHVWIGCNVTVLKGARLPNGSVVASGSVVTANFEEENTLIAGNPAKVIRHNISWH